MPVFCNEDGIDKQYDQLKHLSLYICELGTSVTRENMPNDTKSNWALSCLTTSNGHNFKCFSNYSFHFNINLRISRVAD